MRNGPDPISLRSSSLSNSRKVQAEQSRSRILDAAERLMISDGYAAVTTRGVAAAASVKPALVQYYFRTSDDLFIALMNRAQERRLEKIRAAFAALSPLRALWKLATDPGTSALTIEFRALANHRKAIAKTIAAGGDRLRQLQAEELARYFERDPDRWKGVPPMGLVALLLSIGRSLEQEERIGMSSGQKEAAAIVERLLDWLDPVTEDPEVPRTFSAAPFARD
jgi:TetR/AcrR family transcriptional regulator